ncbi:MAG: cobalamin-binding protein [Desulfobacterales bacterium]
MKKKYYIIIIFLFLPIFFSETGYCRDREVEDRLGRLVHVPANPLRVISFAPSVTEVVFALEQGHRLKGVTRFSNYPPEANNLTQVGSYVHLDVEKIVSLQPDLCLAIKDGNPIEAIRKLESLGIPVYAVDPRNLNAVMEMISDIGDLLNAAIKAENIVENMKERIKRIKTLTSENRERPRVFFQIGVAPIVSVGTETFLHELITLAGGHNLTAGPKPYPRYTVEQVIGMAPDVMVITSMARGQAFDTVRAQWGKWKNIPAVKNNRIYLVDSDIVDRPTPRLVEGLEILAGYIHPEIIQPTP